MQKKYFIVICLILFIISMAAVSAGDINKTDADTDVLTVSNNDVLVDSVDSGTFIELQEKINNASEGSTIELSNNYTYDDTFNAGGIIINKSLTIEGNGFTINAANQARIFFINATNNIVLNNIVFANAKSQQGGAILFEKAITNVSITNSVFTNNSLSDNGYAGGAINFNDDVSMALFENDTFENNYAPSGFGGSITFDKNANLIAFDGCDFKVTKPREGNINGGGAIYFIGNATFVDMENCEFNNFTVLTGGAIFVEKELSNSMFFNNKFINNTALNNKTKYGGGAIAVEGNASNNIFNATSFIMNSAATHGGAVKFMNNDIGNVFVNCTFADNFAPYGGSIAASNNSERLYLIDSTFTMTGETSDEIIGGGAIYFINDVNQLLISGCEFDSLTARTGGAVYIEGNLNDSIINGTEFKNNKATTNNTYYGGGSIAIEGNANYTIILGSEFTNNTALTHGGAIKFRGNNSNIAIVSSRFNDNYAPIAGGISLGNTESLIISRSEFNDNKGTNRDIVGGGALYVIGNLTKARISNSKFINNSARAGGAIFVEGDMDQWTFENDTFNNNSAFTNNTLYGGGAISVEGDATNNIFHNSVFTLNSDTTHGGIIYFMANAINNTISECEFRDNAGGYGGALAVYKNTENLNISNCNFTMQGEPVQRIVGGGALYFINNVTDLNIDNCLFSGYTARTGGAIFFEKTVEKTVIENSIFKNNEITTDNKKYGGGAIYIENNASDFTIRSCGFLDNIASTFGGAIFIKNAKDFLIDDVLFSDNDAQQGNAIYLINGDNVTIQNSYFESTGLGADIYYAGEINSSVINSTFEGSSNIILGESAFVRLSDNTEKGSYFEGDYFLYSKGVLYLEGNDLSNAIYNDGEIISPTVMTIGYNTTVNTTSPLIYLTALCRDDNRNYIVSDYGIFYINDSVHKTFYNDKTELHDSCYLPDYGSYLINATTSGLLSNCTYKYAIVNYAPHKEANINATDIVLDVGQYGEIEVELPEDAIGTVSASINYEIYMAAVKNGKATIIFPPLESGEYEAQIAYSGDEDYLISFTTALITVLEELTVEAPDVTKYYHGSERFVVSVTKSGKAVNNATVEISINGATYTRQTDENGTASIGLNLPSGNYSATVKVDDIAVNSTVTILPTVNGTDITKVYRNGTQYYVTFLDCEGNYLKEGTNVTFNINGVFYNRTISGDKGLARLNINLEQGEYIITAINPNTTEQASNTIIVIPRIVDNHDIVKYFRNATQYTTTILGDDGNPVGKGKIVKFNINGVFYERETNESGQVKLNLNLNPGDYIITAEYEGSMVSNNVTILPTLTAEDLTKKYGADDPFEAKLVDGSGNPYGNQIIEFNINGVLYYRTTDSNGIAKLNINLQAGEYIITSKYGDASISNKITIIA